MATTTATRGIYAKTPERRAEILDAALEVFADAGFRSGALREIAENLLDNRGAFDSIAHDPARERAMRTSDIGPTGISSG